MKSLFKKMQYEGEDSNCVKLRKRVEKIKEHDWT